MKNMKKLLAVLVAVLMVAISMSAIADTNNQTIDNKVTVTGLDAGDKVNFYKLIKWVDGEGWAWATTDIATAATAANIDLATITGKLEGTTFTPGVISAADGAALAKIAYEKATAVNATPLEAASGKVELSLPGRADDPSADTGLYCAIVDPATADTLYNPVFVAADFSQSETSPNTQEATTSLSYSPEALAKKETITVDKDSDGNTDDIKYDHKIGDVIPFTVKSKIPAYSEAYQEPSWVLTDKMDDGLVYQPTAEVTITGGTFTAGTDYVVATTSDGFTVTMTADGLAKVRATGKAQDITVKYNAKLTSLDAGDVTVNEKENTATVKFSNNPEDEDSYSLLEDRTRHYTFSIDANLLGQTDWETSELIKIALSADGSMLTEKVNTKTGSYEYSPLQGAEFTLYTAYTDKDTNTPYSTNGAFANPIITDGNGKFEINGLDEGTYYLVETKAPSGYIKDTAKHTIVVTAEYNEVPGGEYTNEDGVLVKFGAYKVLKKYEVTIDGHKSGYTITNTGESWTKVVESANPGDVITSIPNIQGTELPSTGGMGTTLFYIGGAVLVLGAVVVMITRRRVRG